MLFNWYINFENLKKILHCITTSYLMLITYNKLIMKFNSNINIKYNHKNIIKPQCAKKMLLKKVFFFFVTNIKKKNIRCFSFEYKAKLILLLYSWFKAQNGDLLILLSIFDMSLTVSNISIWSSSLVINFFCQRNSEASSWLVFSPTDNWEF